jgi:hypothetical protein
VKEVSILFSGIGLLALPDLPRRNVLLREGIRWFNSL